MKRKIIALCLIVAMLGVAVISGTMAYFTDTDEAVNVMTIGSVKIEQIEQEWKNGDLVDYTQAKPLLPYVGNLGWDDASKTAQVNGTSAGAYRRFGMENVVDKIVTVKNTGRSDAYVRTIFAFEVGEYTKTEDLWYKVLGISHNAYNGSEFKFDGTWEWSDKKDDNMIVEIDGNNYLIVTATHLNAVKPGETTIPSLLQVYMSKDADNEEAEKLDGNKNGTYDILVISQAIQASGFSDAKTALNADFGEVTAANAKAWFGELDIPVVVSNADELVKALENGEDVVLEDDVKIDPAGMSNAYGTTGINVKNGQTIDGNGNTLDIKGAGGTWDSGICTTGGLIKDITVTGSFRGIFINHNSTHSEPVVLENVTIEGTTYTISCDQGMNQTLTATNSTFKGWTSFAATLGNAKFVDCYFGYGNGYKFCRPYAPTAFVGCKFEAGYTVDPVAAVTFENCTIDGQPLTADNLDTLVTDTAKATVIG